MSYNGTAKEIKARRQENSTIDILMIFLVSFVLMVFRWTGVRSSGCSVLERCLGYKVDIRIPKPWILNEDEVLVMCLRLL